MSELAVVVATRDRAERLRALLDSLAAQEADLDVVVVDDGSVDGTPAVLEGAPLPVRAIRIDHSRGPAAARNAGWRAASAALIAFTDDDCVVQPGWARALCSAAAEDTFVVGRTEPDPRELDRLDAFARTQSVTAAGPYFQTCNIAYPRALLERLGGFDEQFTHFGEDTDLGRRALDAGAEARFADGAVVHHAVHPVGPLGLVRASQRWADAVRLLARHPSLRESLWLGLFWKRSHAALPGVAAAALLARRHPLAALALAAPWAASHRAAHRSLPGLVASLPAHLAVDGAETVAMLRGSCRFRTLVL